MMCNKTEASTLLYKKQRDHGSIKISNQAQMSCLRRGVYGKDNRVALLFTFLLKGRMEAQTRRGGTQQTVGRGGKDHPKRPRTDKGIGGLCPVRYQP